MRFLGFSKALHQPEAFYVSSLRITPNRNCRVSVVCADLPTEMIEREVQRNEC
jgi:hypothetical protein